MVGFGASLLGVVVGTAIGVTCRLFRRLVSTRSPSALMDAMLAFPMLLLGAGDGGGAGLVGAQRHHRARHADRAARRADFAGQHADAQTRRFIEAVARDRMQDLRTIVQHILPNTFAPLLVIATAYLGLAIVQEAALDYLGAGIQEPQPSWGLMMSGSATSLALTAPWIVLFPGFAITLVVLASNLLGDAIRDVLDPEAPTN